MENPYEQKLPRPGLAEGERYASNRLKAAQLCVLRDEPTLLEAILVQRAHYEGSAWRKRTGLPEYEGSVVRQVFRAEPQKEPQVDVQMAEPVSLDSALRGPVA